MSIQYALNELVPAGVERVNAHFAGFDWKVQPPEEVFRLFASYVEQYGATLVPHQLQEIDGRLDALAEALELEKPLADDQKRHKPRWVREEIGALFLMFCTADSMWLERWEFEAIKELTGAMDPPTPLAALFRIRCHELDLPDRMANETVIGTISADSIRRSLHETAGCDADQVFAAVEAQPEAFWGWLTNRKQRRRQRLREARNYWDKWEEAAAFLQTIAHRGNGAVLRILA